MKLNQNYSHCLIGLCCQALKSASQGRCRTCPDADDIFNGWLGLLLRSANNHHMTAISYSIDKVRKGPEHALQCQTLSEQLVRPACHAICCLRISASPFDMGHDLFDDH